jgi:hypothetical protein
MRLNLQQELLKIESSPTLRTAPYGEVIKHNGKYLMKLKPTQWLLNSSLVADVLNRADCFVCNIETGTLYIMSGDKEVSYTEAAMHITEKGS